MRDTIDIQRLWLNPKFACIVKRKDLQEIMLEYADQWGRSTIIVQGTIRQLAFKSIGGGLYRLYTTEPKPIET